MIARVAALRFFFIRTLKRHEFREDLPYPKDHRRLPTVLSLEEVARLINAAENLLQRALLMTLYGTGMRRTEVSLLKLSDIDSQRARPGAVPPKKLPSRRFIFGSFSVHYKMTRVAALRFFFIRTLKRHEFREDLPYPKDHRRLPTVLSLEEVARLINAAGNLLQSTTKSRRSIPRL